MFSSKLFCEGEIVVLEACGYLYKDISDWLSSVTNGKRLEAFQLERCDAAKEVRKLGERHP